MKFAVILGNLGNTSDRFLSSGYKDELSKDQLFKQATSIEGVEGIELVGNWDISPETAPQMKKYLEDSGIKLVSIVPDHFSLKKWGKGAFTSRDPKIRKEAISHTKEMIDILTDLGGELINIWPGQDGYDYLFQGNFDEAYDWFVDGIKECARYKPEVKISLEFKPKEPRNFCYLARSADTLLVAQETGMDNVGVTVDVGHAFVAGENVSEAIYRLVRAGKLFHMHWNDNHLNWDDDMIVGTVHTLHYLEMFFWLKKLGYNGWWSMDQYPYREDGKAALSESIKWIKALNTKLETYGTDKLEKLVREGEATKTSAELRKMLLG